MSLPLAAAGPSLDWYLARGTGFVALILLTAAVVLGVLGSERYSAPRWPRFAIDRMHRDVSLLVLAVLLVHIVTSVLDAFAPIVLRDAVIPFLSAYRPLWLGLGAVAFDILLAVSITSLVRHRLGYRAWRAVHWAAYASWPVAVFHGLGTGSDAKHGWSLAITAVCVLAVALAVTARVLRARPPDPARRPLWLGLTATTLAGLAVFTVLGPLAPHWARRAGTPADLLSSARAAAPAVLAPPPAAAGAAEPARDRISIPFTARLAGSITQTNEPDGAIIDIDARASGGISGEMRVRMAGAPLGGGGLSMVGSEVQLTAVGLTSALQGKIDALQGQEFEARVSNASGTTLEIRVTLAIDNSNDTVAGTISGRTA